MLREHEMGARVVDNEGTLWVRTVERDQGGNRPGRVSYVSPASILGGDALQYVELDIVRRAAAMLADAEEAGQNVGCEAEEDEGRLCGRPAAYLVPDATRAGGDGREVERRPAMYCRGHLEEMLGHAPEERPGF